MTGHGPTPARTSGRATRDDAQPPADQPAVDAPPCRADQRARYSWRRVMTGRSAELPDHGEPDVDGDAAGFEPDLRPPAIAATRALRRAAGYRAAASRVDAPHRAESAASQLRELDRGRVGVTPGGLAGGTAQGGVVLEGELHPLQPDGVAAGANSVTEHPAGGGEVAEDDLRVCSAR